MSPLTAGPHIPPGPVTADVVVVDDEPEIRSAVREYLESCGRRVIEAANGLEALWCLKHYHPRAVILDLAMPRLSGLDTIRHIRRFDPTIRIVVVSGYLSPETTDTLRQLGIAALSKPADLTELDRLLVSAPPAR